MKDIQNIAPFSGKGGASIASSWFIKVNTAMHLPWIFAVTNACLQTNVATEFIIILMMC
jgi:hypothetical protein